MQSFLILSPNEEKGLTFIHDYCTKHSIDVLDRTIFSLETQKKKNEKALSFTIESIRDIQKQMYLTPFKGTQKAIIIASAGQLTLPAQNALLKMLEEPPAHTLLFLLAKNTDAFIPTVLSRVFLFSVENTFVDDIPESKELLQGTSPLKPSQALKYAEILAKDSSKTLSILEQTLVVLRQNLFKKIEAGENSSYEKKAMREILKAHTTLSRTNTNTRMTLEHVFLTLSQDR